MSDNTLKAGGNVAIRITSPCLTLSDNEFFLSSQALITKISFRKVNIFEMLFDIWQ